MALSCYLRPAGALEPTVRVDLGSGTAEATARTALATAKVVPAGAIWYPPAERHLLEHDVGGQLTESMGLVQHVQDGDGDPYGWFDRPDVDGSSHWWVSKRGRIVQYVPANRQAWTQKAGNRYWHSVETEGRPGEPLTVAQIVALAGLFAWGMAWWGWPPQVTDRTDRRGLGTHQMGGAAWGGHACPGTIRANQRGQVVALAARGVPHNPNEEDDVDDDGVRAVLDEGTGAGQTGWAGTSRATLAAAQESVNVGRTAARSAAEALTVLARIERAVGDTTPGPLYLDEVYAAVRRSTPADLPMLAAIGAAVTARVAEFIPSSTPPSGVRQ